MARAEGREIYGVLNINKSAGMTSHDVVDAVRRLYHVRKVGHTGTLDPRGTGVLPLCLGRATKIAQFLTSADKEYDIVVHLGVATDTQDADGKVIGEAEVRVTREEVERALTGFVGEIQQVPPPLLSETGTGRAPVQGGPPRRGRSPATRDDSDLWPTSHLLQSPFCGALGSLQQGDLRTNTLR